MRSHWLEQALAADTDVAPRLEGEQRADVCIVGGGYAGLWTAIELKRAEPSLDVALVEADICGGGTSGRNAGYLVDLWVKFPLLKQMFGADEALRLCRASEAASDEIRAFCEENAIDAQFRREGWLWSAGSEAQLGAWDSVIEELARHQVRVFEVWERDRVRAETCFASELGGAFQRSLATVQPARLVRGLRRVAIKQGVRILEHSPMHRLERTRPPRVHTPVGRMTAERVVLTMNAWSLAVPELRSAMAIVGADMAASPPVPERLAELGWASGPAVVDSNIFSTFFRATPDGHVTVGRGGGLLNFGYRLRGHFDGPSRRTEALRAVLARIHPSLTDLAFATSWSGPIDRTRSGLPLFGHLPTCPDVFYGYGFSGNGIVPARLGGRILSALLRDRDDEWARSGLVRPVERDFPPEPVRYLGASMVHAAIERKDRLSDKGQRAGPLTRRLAALGPASFKPTVQG
jgi:glycine/D-amino acid oxidase-like deaminating enzyme